MSPVQTSVQKMRPIRITVFVIILSVFLANCGSQKPNNASRTSTQNAPIPVKELPRFTPFTIALTRGGGFSGLQERYQLSDDGSTQKTSKLPGEPERTLPSHSATEMVEPVRSYLDRHFNTLDTLHLQLTGNMTTAIEVTMDGRDHRYSWPNLDPPRIETIVLDSLYQLMLETQSMMSGG